MKQARRVLGKSHRVLLVWKMAGQPAATFGSEVHGTNTTVLRWMRATASRLSPGGGPGASINVVLALHSDNDPGRRAVLGPILRSAEEVWTLSDPGLRNSRTLTAGVLITGAQKVAK